MPVECAEQYLPVGVPTGHPRVVVHQLVQRQRQVPIRCLPNFVQLAVRAVGVEHLAKDLDARAVAKELPGREQIAPERHPVLDGAIVVAHFGESLARHDVERLPLRQLLGQHRPNLCAVVVLRPRRPIPANPLFTGLARLRLRENPFLVDDGEELLAHPSVPRLGLDDLAVDHPPTIGPRGRCRRRATPCPATVQQPI